MEYKVFDLSLIPQLTRLFASASDDKAAYVISLNTGKTEKDLLTCLNFRPNGAGYYFDVTKLTSDIGVLLGTGNDCTRTLVGNQLNFSKCNITCSAVGKPTHLILGGIIPFSFEIGKDVKLLHVDSGSSVDSTGEGSVVTVNAFGLRLNDIDTIPVSSATIPSIWFRTGYADPPYYQFDDIQTGLMRQIGTGDFEFQTAINYFNGSFAVYPMFSFTSAIGSNNNPVDGLSLYFQYMSNSPQLVRYILTRTYTKSDEIYVSENVPYGATLTLRRVGGVVRLYVNGVQLKLYKQSDTSFSTPVDYSLAFDLSKLSIFRIGQFYLSSPNGAGYGLAQSTINKL
ncbi:hypothetical protein JA33_079 [Dickeya phage vB_DsoM_JA33]|uniref:Uncharacterized protein n=2 Tax=Salmondvirus JA11 TaxID=2734141 RepID=A0A386K5N9_9CAUD|nr:hypothetical protein HOU32_gp079 [Dickeya phage vB_DsoM_JA11]AXG67453.1 hypothetical protein JA33_079 [Dickeya phage vB_DsoM_JA33]AYD79884.1 hypothetical protein JA11_079 [Dickeya phage vB_DsoM_JA11]